MLVCDALVTDFVSLSVCRSFSLLYLLLFLLLFRFVPLAFSVLASFPVAPARIISASLSICLSLLALVLRSRFSLLLFSVGFALVSRFCFSVSFLAHISHSRSCLFSSSCCCSAFVFAFALSFLLRSLPRPSIEQ